MPQTVPLPRVPVRSRAGRTGASAGPWCDQCGLTVFELLVAMTISGILSGIAIVGYGNALHKARVAKAIAEIRLIERELAKYELDYGNLPDALAEIAWRARDPWGNPYEYLRIQFKATGGGGNGNGNGNGSGNGNGNGNSPGPADDGGRGALGNGGSGDGGNGGNSGGGGGGNSGGGGGNSGGGGGNNGGGGGNNGGGGGNNGGGGGNNGGGGNGNEGGCAGGHGHPQGARKDRFLVPINCDYDLYSKGPDGESKVPLTAKQSHDDIIRAGDGAFVGVASDF